MTHRSVNAAAIGPQRGMGGAGERHGARKRIPSKNYCVGDHNLGHGGNWTEYLEPGVAPYVDTWFEEGVDDYFRAQHEIKMEKYKDTVMPPQ